MIGSTLTLEYIAHRVELGSAFGGHRAPAKLLGGIIQSSPGRRRGIYSTYTQLRVHSIIARRRSPLTVHSKP